MRWRRELCILGIRRMFGHSSARFGATLDERGDKMISTWTVAKKVTEMLGCFCIGKGVSVGDDLFKLAFVEWQKF